MAGFAEAAAHIDGPVRFNVAPTVIPMAWLWLRAFVGFPSRSTPYARIQLPHQALRLGGPRIVRNLKRSIVDRSGGRRLAVDVWTVNDEAAISRSLRAEVDGIMTDRPTLLRDVIAKATERGA